MKKFAVLLALLASVFAVAACGSNNNPTVTPDTLASAMDEVCTDTNADFEAMGTRGLTMDGIAAEFEGYAEVRQAVVDGFNELNTDDQAEPQLQKYIDASEQVIAQASPEDAAVHARAYNVLGASLKKAGRTKEALLAYLHVDVLYASQAQAHAEALRNLAELWSAVNQPQRAAQALQTLQDRYQAK